VVARLEENPSKGISQHRRGKRCGGGSSLVKSDEVGTSPAARLDNRRRWRAWKGGRRSCGAYSRGNGSRRRGGGGFSVEADRGKEREKWGSGRVHD
jgi:hypothetical protein